MPNPNDPKLCRTLHPTIPPPDADKIDEKLAEIKAIADRNNTDPLTIHTFDKQFIDPHKP